MFLEIKVEEMVFVTFTNWLSEWHLTAFCGPLDEVPDVGTDHMQRNRAPLLLCQPHPSSSTEGLHVGSVCVGGRVEGESTGGQPPVRGFLSQPSQRPRVGTLDPLQGVGFDEKRRGRQYQCWLHPVLLSCWADRRQPVPLLWDRHTWLTLAKKGQWKWCWPFLSEQQQQQQGPTWVSGLSFLLQSPWWSSGWWGFHYTGPWKWPPGE